MIVPRDDIRRFMNLQPDTMAGAVDESVAIASVLGYFTGRTIDVLCFDAWFDRLDGGLLSLADDPVYCLELVRRFPVKDDSSGLIARIAVYERAEIEDDRITTLDLSIAVSMVGLRAVRSPNRRRPRTRYPRHPGRSGAIRSRGRARARSYQLLRPLVHGS